MEWQLHNLKFFTVETMLIQAVLLWIILYVLNRYIFKPYVAFLDKESEKREKLEKDYKNIDWLIADANDKSEKILKDARDLSSSIISDSEALANKKRTSILEKAEEEAKWIIKASASEIEKERLGMLDAVKSKLIGLILKFNSKLFWEEKISKDYLEKELSNIK